MTDATRQATVAIVLRERIAKREEYAERAERHHEIAMAANERATARALAEFLLAWEAPNAALQEVLDYAEARKREGKR